MNKFICILCLWFFFYFGLVKYFCKDFLKVYVWLLFISKYNNLVILILCLVLFFFVSIVMYMIFVL